MKRLIQAGVIRLAGITKVTFPHILNNRIGSRVSISEETRRQVPEAVAEPGCAPGAQARRSGGAKTISLDIPGIHTPYGTGSIVREISEDQDTALEVILRRPPLQSGRIGLIDWIVAQEFVNAPDAAEGTIRHDLDTRERPRLLTWVRAGANLNQQDPFQNHSFIRRHKQQAMVSLAMA